MPIPEQNQPANPTSTCLSPPHREVSSGDPSNEQETHVVKAWHQLEAHRPLRDAILAQIFDLLRSRFPNKRDDSIRKISERFEIHIYHTADSLAEYRNLSTLKQRLFLYALSRREGPAPCPSCGSKCEFDHERETTVCAAGSACPGASRDPLVMLREQQHLILQLRHASRCLQGPQCVLQHCAALRQRWTHCSSCRDAECRTPQCVSTRHVLNHYTMCQDMQCRLCRPVKELIRRVQLTEQSINISNSTIRRMVGEPPRGVKAAACHDINAHLAPSCCMHTGASKRSRQGEGANTEKRPRHTRPSYAGPQVGGGLREATDALRFMSERAAMKGLVFSNDYCDRFDTDSEEDYY